LLQHSGKVRLSRLADKFLASDSITFCRLTIEFFNARGRISFYPLTLALRDIVLRVSRPEQGRVRSTIQLSGINRIPETVDRCCEYEYERTLLIDYGRLFIQNALASISLTRIGAVPSKRVRVKMQNFETIAVRASRFTMWRDEFRISDSFSGLITSFI